MRLHRIVLIVAAAVAVLGCRGRDTGHTAERIVVPSKPATRSAARFVRAVHGTTLRRGSMARRIIIRFPADRDDAFYFRVFCWADDTLYPAIDQLGYGTIHDLDRVRETVQIDVKRHRKVAEIMRLIRKTLPQHFPDCQPIVEGPNDAAAGGG